MKEKLKENLSNETITSIFLPRLIKCNLQSQSDFFTNSVKSSKYRLNSSPKIIANDSDIDEAFKSIHQQSIIIKINNCASED